MTILIENKPVTHNNIQKFQLSKPYAFGAMSNIHPSLATVRNKNSKHFGGMIFFGNPAQRNHSSRLKTDTLSETKQKRAKKKNSRLLVLLGVLLVLVVNFGVVSGMMLVVFLVLVVDLGVVSGMMLMMLLVFNLGVVSGMMLMVLLVLDLSIVSGMMLMVLLVLDLSIVSAMVFMVLLVLNLGVVSAMMLMVLLVLNLGIVSGMMLMVLLMLERRIRHFLNFQSECCLPARELHLQRMRVLWRRCPEPQVQRLRRRAERRRQQRR